jgi:hypothetical protein
MTGRRTGRTEQAEQDRKNGTGRTAEEGDSENRTGRTGEPEEGLPQRDRQNRTEYTYIYMYQNMIGGT